MKLIPLTQGKFAIVDDDFYFFEKIKWYASKGRYTFYARTIKNKKIIGMHRIIMNNPQGKIVDHIDGNGLNNQRSNLRICSAYENKLNKKIPKNNTSGFMGIDYVKRRKQFYWRARIRLKGREFLIGYFHCKDKAMQAYKNFTIKSIGDFACRNQRN